MKCYLNEKGETVTIADEIRELNEKLKAAIQPKIANIMAEYELNIQSRKPRNIKFGGRATQAILTELSRLTPMSRADYVAMDYEDLSAWYTGYMEFLYNYAMLEVPPTRQLFCAYMGISVSKFVDLMNDDSDFERKEKAIMINDDFNAMVFSQAESSNNNSRAILTRAKIKEAGQGLIKQTDEVNINMQNIVSPEILMQKVHEIINNQRKKLGIKK